MNAIETLLDKPIFQALGLDAARDRDAAAGDGGLVAGEDAPHRVALLHERGRPDGAASRPSASRSGRCRGRRGAVDAREL